MRTNINHGFIIMRPPLYSPELRPGNQVRDSCSHAGLPARSPACLLARA